MTTKDYWVGVTIGEGMFGRVVHGRHKQSHKHVAIKVYDKVSVSKYRLMESIWTERTLLQELEACPWVVNLWSAFLDQECVYLVMDCLQGGTLQDLISDGQRQQQQNWRTAVVPYYALQLVRAVQAIHNQSIVHADLSPQNVLLTSQGKLQLADFGSALRLDPNKEKGQAENNNSHQQQSTTTATPRGTVDYASPEIVRGAHPSEVTEAVDGWSLGCILAALLYGQSPFHAESDSLAVTSIMNYVNGGILMSVLDKHDTGHGDDIDKAWNSLILQLLNPDPNKRLERIKSDSLAHQIPGYEAIDPLENSPAALPPKPKWVKEAKQTKMRDGNLGWSAFLL